jgi:S1-C subfamily serine protease
VRDSQDLINKVADLDPGAKVKIKYFRNDNGKALDKSANITLVERPSEKELLKKQMRAIGR